MNKQIEKRLKSERKFKSIGLGAIVISLMFLFFLVSTIFLKGINGFTSSEILLDVTFSKKEVEHKEYSKIIRNSFDKIFPNITELSERKALYKLTSDGSKFLIQDITENEKNIIGQTKQIWLPVNEDIEIYLKQNAKNWQEKAKPAQQNFIKSLQEQDRVKTGFNYSFFTNSDSQESELAGIAGGMIGSLLTIISCITLAIPLGVLAAVYLEEFAPKNRATSLLEVNINNLAAVPSIVYGLLGLAVYINFFGMPRSASIVGGLTLALMVVPVIIISTRASLKAVPPSIRQAAMGVGASPLQIVLHHTLPLALPGIMTGTILGIARALGETAPLLMIGMVAFIADVPQNFTDPSSALPVQIFLWSKNNQVGFVEKTAAAILILLTFMILLNLIAVRIRKKYERRW